MKTKYWIAIIIFISLSSCMKNNTVVSPENEIKMVEMNSIKDTERNIDLYLRYKYFENYIFLELGIKNCNKETIYILKNYYIDEIIEENGKLKLSIKSSWLSAVRPSVSRWVSAMYHNPPMVEIRENQTAYLTLLLEIPEKNNRINDSDEINEIIGIKYSMQKYITNESDTSLAMEKMEYYNSILTKLNDLKYKN